ncbi:hypothetical protein O3M35_003868 [Rhynocoris fuscipes]|uniref:T-complex protein 11-like protein 1 n=1 Tax=Rhynocoris fuscipes TaxID=488301 RepID=A0AAW1CHX7_9HEMI
MEGSSKDSQTPGTPERRERRNVDLETLFQRLSIAHRVAIEEELARASSSSSEAVATDTKEKTEEETLRSSVREAFWSAFTDQLNQQPPKLELAFDVLSEIKQSLEAVMTPNIVSLRHEVRAVLDIDFLKEQAEKGALDVKYYASFIINVVSKICAPVRDEEVAALKQESDIVALFRGILEVLAKMKTDLAAYSLQAIKPNILANHFAYERDTFRDYVAALGGSLPITSKWLLKHKMPSKSMRDVVNDAYIELITWDPKEPYPETFIFDIERLQKLKVDFFRITMTSTLMFLLFGMIPRELQSDDTFKAYVKKFTSVLLLEASSEEHVKEVLPNITSVFKCKVEESLKEKVPPVTFDVDYQVIGDTLEQALQPDNKIRVLVCTRVKEFLRLALSKGPAADQFFPAALTLVKPEIKAFLGYFETVCRHNYLVTVEHYDRILNSTVEQN